MAVVASAAAAEHTGVRQPAAAPARQAAEQAGVIAGQLAAGAGNLAFSLVAARILDPGGFAHLATFLGLYLVLSLPATSISAAAALAPGRDRRQAQRVALGSVAAGLFLAAFSPVIAPALNLPVALVVALGLATPAAGPLALERGRLYGQRRHRQVVASLLAEPAVRLSAGVALAAGAGAVGGAAGVVLAAYAALEVARSAQRRRRYRPALDLRVPAARHFAPARATPPSPVPGAAGWTAAAFVLLAVVQNQDLFFANDILPAHQAGVYAALSTVGGAAAFATATIPLVLIPRIRDGQRHTLAVAAGLAAGLGLCAVLVGAAVPGLLAGTLFGAQYRSIAGMLVPYLAAMGLLGVARVFVAERCAAGSAGRAVATTAAVAAGQAAAIAAFGHSVPSIAWTTLAATACLSAVLGAEQIVRLPARHRRFALRRHLALRRRLAVLARPSVAAVGAMTLAGLAVRLVIFRGIWLDEATSIHEASLSFGGMLNDLRTTDVHPPLYFSVLWVDDRLLGNGSFAMRIPSIIAGTLVIPAAYLAARDLWDRRTGLAAAMVATLSPILVWYSQEARMYSMFMLFALVAIWGQARVLRRGNAADWAIYAVASVALGWTEYFALFQVVAQQMVFVAVAWARRSDREALRRFLIGWAVSAAAILACFAPLIPFAWHQFIVNQNAGRGFGTPSQVGLSAVQGISIYAVLANLAWAILGYHSAPSMAAIVALWPVGILASLLLLGRRIGRSGRLLLVAAVVPTVMLLGLGMVKRNLFDIRYISGVVVVLVLLTARVIISLARSGRLRALACAALAAILAFAMFDEQVNGSNPRRYDFASSLHSVNVQYRPGDELVYLPADLNLVVGYYSPQVRAAPLGQLSTKVRPGAKVFVLASRSLMNARQPALLSTEVSRLGQADRQLAVVHKANVTVWVFQAPAAGPRSLALGPPAVQTESTP